MKPHRSPFLQIEVADQLAADTRDDLPNLCDQLLVVEIGGEAILHLGIGHPIRICDDDDPVPDIRSGVTAAKTVADVALLPIGFHPFRQRRNGIGWTG